MRLSPASIDLEAYRAFVEGAGAAFEAPQAACREVLRFTVGGARGTVARRKDGRLTFAGHAAHLCLEFRRKTAIVAAAPAVATAAKIVKATLVCGDHARARELLSNATTATVFTDGSCERGGFGAGGWAAIIQAGFVTVEIYGGANLSTVNRMEITAAIAALALLPDGCTIKLKTDSQYLRRGITEWIDGWKHRGWVTVARTPVKNDDLWRRLDAESSRHEITWKWVPAHRGIKQNERADELARLGRTKLNKRSSGKTNDDAKSNVIAQ
jgi:ribonuclease HI